MRFPLAFFLAASCLGAVVAQDSRSELGIALKDIEPASHWIYDDWSKALEEAKSSGKPLLVVLRCVPCPPGRTLDAAVMQPDAELAEIEKQFVCVRIIQANRLDLELFQYDYDMSWAAMFLHADGTVYGRYGSRDASGPASDRLLATAAFKKAAERALVLHRDDPAVKHSLRAKRGSEPAYKQATDIPGLTDRPREATMRQNCIHCHMVKEYALRAKWEAGKLTKEDLFVYPQPTNLGLTMDVEDGLLVREVEPHSAAAKAGLAAGDRLERINEQPLISLADIQWALHRAAEDEPLRMSFVRGGKLVSTVIEPPAGWQKSDIAWRASSWYGLRQGFKTEPLTEEDKQARGLARGSLALAVKLLAGKGGPKLQAAGIKKDDVIVAVDGRTEAMTESDFLVFLRTTHGPQDTVRFTILRGQERKELAIPLW
jgi:serine protease Do